MADKIVEAGHRPRQKRYELETIEGGWVELRRLNHGESNELSDNRLAFHVQQDDDKKSEGAKAAIQSKLGRHYAFSKCIVSHNLGVNGKLFDFKKRRDVDDLDAVIGDEIATLIETHNETLEEAGDVPN